MKVEITFQDWKFKSFHKTHGYIFFVLPHIRNIYWLYFTVISTATARELFNWNRPFRSAHQFTIDPHFGRNCSFRNSIFSRTIRSLWNVFIMLCYFFCSNIQRNSTQQIKVIKEKKKQYFDIFYKLNSYPKFVYQNCFCALLFYFLFS